MGHGACVPLGRVGEPWRTWRSAACSPAGAPLASACLIGGEGRGSQVQKFAPAIEGLVSPTDGYGEDGLGRPWCAVCVGLRRLAGWEGR